MSHELTRRAVLTAGAAAGLAAHAPPAWSQVFPSKPIRFVVTFAPGGGADTVARTVNERYAQALGQSVVVENKPGAGGTIATDYIAKSAPDGYSLLFTVSSHSINQALYPSLPFDTERDLRGVTLIAAVPQLIAVHPSVPASNLKELIALGDKDERYRQYASGGVGSPGHFAAGLIQSRIGKQLTHIGYRGAGPAMTDVVGNQVPMIVSTMSGLMSHVRAGRLKAIGITSKERSPELPNVETVAESGLPGYDGDTWVGTFVPRATPDDVVARLHAAMAETLKDATVAQRIGQQGGRVLAEGPQALDKLVADEIKAFTKVVKEQGIKPE